MSTRHSYPPGLKAERAGKMAHLSFPERKFYLHIFKAVAKFFYLSDPPPKKKVELKEIE